MAEDQKGEQSLAPAPATGKNPHFEVVLNDVKSRSKWSRIDEEICKRRLGERPKSKTYPYQGAPNGVVPIVDDSTRERTTQEISMIANAPRFAHIIPLSPEMPMEVRRQAELAFDTYLRYVLVAQPKMEEAVDTKNARGFGVVKTQRTEHPRFGTVPDFDAVDPRDIIVPAGTKDIQQAERIVHVFRYSEREFKALARSKKWRWAETVAALSKTEGRDGKTSREELEDTFGVTMHLVGLTTSGEGNEHILVWEMWKYADEWDVKQDPTGRVKKGRRCRLVFSPDAPDYVLAITPWRERDEYEEMSYEEAVRENVQAIEEGRRPVFYRRVLGQDRPWPFVQSRFENRSRFFYDSRGVGHLCMDDQIFATGMLNAKMTMVDYYSCPRFTGPNRNSGNITHEPGSFVPGDVKPVEMPQIPQQFDFDIDLHKRNAARRVNAGSQYQFSGDTTAKKRVQKTAREVHEESARTAMVSSADVDRFNTPWAEVYQQLWEDLKRLEKPLPMLDQGDFVGMAGPEIYRYPVLVVPASSSKTLNPEMQFERDARAFDLLAAMSQYGVSGNFQAVAEDIFANWDPFRSRRWISDPRQPGPNGLPPVYQLLQQLSQSAQNSEEMLKAMREALEATSKLADENAQRLDQMAGGAGGVR